MELNGNWVNNVLYLRLVDFFFLDEVEEVVLDLVVLTVLGISDITLHIDKGIDWSVNHHADWNVENKTEHEVAAEVVNEHVVAYKDLMLCAHEIEDGNHWGGVVHSDR